MLERLGENHSDFLACIATFSAHFFVSEVASMWQSVAPGGSESHGACSLLEALTRAGVLESESRRGAHRLRVSPAHREGLRALLAGHPRRERVLRAHVELFVDRCRSACLHNRTRFAEPLHTAEFSDRADELLCAWERALHFSVPGAGWILRIWKNVNSCGAANVEEQARLFDRALEEPDIERELEFILVLARTTLSWRMGDTESARKMVEVLFDSPAPSALPPFFLAEAHNTLGVLCHLDGDPASSASCFEGGLRVMRREGSTHGEIVALINLSIALQEAGERERARPPIEEALALAREPGAGGYLGSALVQLGNLQCEEGQFEDADRTLEVALEKVHPFWAYHVDALTTAAICDLALRRIDRATDRLQEALIKAEQLSARRDIGRCLTWLSVCAASRGDTGSAWQWHSEARQHLEGCDEVRLRHSSAAALLIRALELEARACDPASGNGALPRPARAAEDLSRELRELNSTQPGGDSSILLQMARRTLERAEDSIRQSESTLLIVASKGRRFFLSSLGWIGLGRKRVAARLLDALVEARLERPGQAMSKEELFFVGWPHQRVDPSSLRNRTYVAMNTLRKLGLTSVIRTSDNGYMIDERVQVRRAS